LPRSRSASRRHFWRGRGGEFAIVVAAGTFAGVDLVAFGVAAGFVPAVFAPAFALTYFL
jgi:hypothetical protein